MIAITKKVIIRINHTVSEKLFQLLSFIIIAGGGGEGKGLTSVILQLKGYSLVGTNLQVVLWTPIS